MLTNVMDEREAAEEAAGLWWVFLVTGILWSLVALIVLRFDYTSVGAIAVLFGVVVIFAGVNEFIAMAGSSVGWKIAHVLLGLVFVVAGIVAFVQPGGTFAALAGVMSFVLVLKGVFDIIVAIATKGEFDVWWLQLVVGIVEILLGFWAAGYWGRSAVLLVAWVAAIALARAITEIIFAFKLRGVKKELAAG